jgi:uncharacterized protein (TIRG00374 family)
LDRETFAADPPPDPAFEKQWEDEVAEADAEARAEPRKGATRWLRWIVVLLLLYLAYRLIKPQLGDLSESARVLRTMRPWAVALAIASEMLSYVALGFMMKRIVGLTGQNLTLHRAFGVTLAAGSVGLIAGGLAGIGGSSFRWLRDAGIRAEGALLAGWLPTLLNAATIGAFAIIGMFELVLFQRLSLFLWIAFGSSLALLIAVGAAVFWASGHREAAKNILRRWEGRWARLRKQEPAPEGLLGTVDRLFDAFHILKTRGWKAPVAGAVLGVILDMGAMFWLYVAVRHLVTPGKLLSGYALPLLIGKVAVIPGGIGVVETAMVSLYQGFGVPGATAGVVVLAYRVIAFWMPNLLGFCIIPFLQIPTRRTGQDLLPGGRRRSDPRTDADDSRPAS